MATTAALSGQALSSLPSVTRGGHSSQLTQGTASCPVSLRLPPFQSSRLRQHASRSVAVRAGENEGEAPEGGQEDVRRLTRGPPSDGRKWGYTEFDSAGQKNIYAVEPRIYVANNGLSTGKKGTEGQGNSTAILIGVGLAVAVGAFASLNFLGNAPSATPSAAITSVAGVDVPPLSFYIEKFSQKPALETASLPAPEVSSEAVASANEAKETIPQALATANEGAVASANEAKETIPQALATVTEGAVASANEAKEMISQALAMVTEGTAAATNEAKEVTPEAVTSVTEGAVAATNEATEVIPEAVASVTEGIAVTSSAE